MTTRYANHGGFNESEMGQNRDQSESISELLKPRVRQAQIITFALIQGVLLFGVIALFLNQAQLNGQPDILTWIAVGFAAIALMNHLLIPSLIVRAQLSALSAQDVKNGIDQNNLNTLSGIFLSQHIVACAIPEGAAMFGIVAYLVEHNWYSLAAAGVMLLLIAARFPTETSIRYWIENRIREIQLK